MTLLTIANHALFVGGVIHLLLKSYLAWHEVRNRLHAD